METKHFSYQGRCCTKNLIEIYLSVLYEDIVPILNRIQKQIGPGHYFGFENVEEERDEYYDDEPNNVYNGNGNNLYTATLIIEDVLLDTLIAYLKNIEHFKEM